jgi:hypothetical protein
MGQILLTGEEPQEWSALLCYVVADRSAQHRIARFEGVKNRALRSLTLNLELHFATNVRQCSQMCRKYDSDHVSVWTSTAPHARGKSG